jgi:microcystin-dependent protein
MAQPFIGQILTFAGTFAPLNYALCNGQLLQISQNTTLYQLIGATYGGDGVQTFALPNLQSRVPVHVGQGNGLSAYVLGEPGGSEDVTLSTSELPSHTHAINVVTGPGTLATPGGSTYLATQAPTPAGNADAYLAYSAANIQIPLASNSVTQTGQSLPHPNIQPVQAITYCIALYGIFPTQS